MHPPPLPDLAASLGKEMVKNKIFVKEKMKTLSGSWSGFLLLEEN